MWLDLFVRYGYAMVVVGTLVEADPTLLAATFLAHRGYFNLRTVLLLALLTTIAVNQGYFWLARRYRDRLVSGSRRRLVVERVSGWLQRLGIPVVIASRFVYGCRIAVPVACGSTGMSGWRFTAADVTGAVIWTGVFGLAGRAISHLLEVLIADVHRHEIAVAFGILGAGTLALWWRARTVAARTSV